MMKKKSKKKKYHGPELTKDGRHKFKWMKFDGEKVRIDKDIAFMIEMMWKLGIRTINSCHGHCSFNCTHKRKIVRDKDGAYSAIVPTANCWNSIWLVFEQSCDVEKFYNIVAEYSERAKSAKTATMYDHILGIYRKQNRQDVWELKSYTRNYGIQGHWGRPIINGKRTTYKCWVEDGCENNDFIMQPQLTFPRKHIEYVEARLKEALKKKK